MTELRWEDPPLSRRGLNAWWQEAAAKLRAKPGTWAILCVVATLRRAQHLAWRIRDGRLVNFGKGKFEAVARTVDDEHRVYARYMGDLS